MSPSHEKSSLTEFHALHNEAIIISKNLARNEFLLIEVLQKIDERKVYRAIGFKSLFQYATVALKLDANRAYTFIQVARKAARLSEFQSALKQGLSLSKAKRVTSVITKENEGHWIDLAKRLPQKLLERAVCKVNPRSSVEEGTRFVSENTLEFRAAISVETENLIKRVQDVLSQSKQAAVGFDEALRKMADTFLDKNDPVRKAQRILSKQVKMTVNDAFQEQNSRPAISKNSAQDLRTRKSLTNQLKHQVHLRDQGKCQETNCEDARWIDIHHIRPVSEGGDNILENLITLCRVHHQGQHA
jgi:5-methylcytosine-specific restriction endonuclease McrA